MNAILHEMEVDYKERYDNLYRVYQRIDKENQRLKERLGDLKLEFNQLIKLRHRIPMMEREIANKRDKIDRLLNQVDELEYKLSSMEYTREVSKNQRTVGLLDKFKNLLSI